ncbi:MAG: GNAT family N-acetyltransferase [Zoogloea sp.]|uniref:GNAT family N-acetyltransferase n=1 Tax=Zoogloea sp. TaxID=49181 RepID=UPI003F3B1A39
MITLRQYRPEDAPALNALALSAFDEFQDAYQDWPGFRAKIGQMAELSVQGEIIVAEQAAELLGAVVYVGPHQPKASFFQREWSVMRMLVVAPEHRGQGIAHQLIDACLYRARQDQANAIALHTSPVMKVALPLYERLGFRKIADAPPIHGVAYGIYLHTLPT